MSEGGRSPVTCPRVSPARPAVYVPESLFEELIHVCLYSLPHKAYGLIGGVDLYHPKSIYRCSTNLRNEPEWKAIFESYGEFYLNPDLGFVISAMEVKEVQEVMASRGESFVGVFHSHRYLPAEPTPLDVALNMSANLVSYIVSVVDPSSPVVRAFCLTGDGCRNIPIIRVPDRE
jgi:proteasome lid subunit RPN8/RPN11